MKFILHLILLTLSIQVENDSVSSAYFNFNYSAYDIIGNLTLKSIELNGTKYIINQGKEFENYKVSQIVQFDENKLTFFESPALAYLMEKIVLVEYNCWFNKYGRMLCPKEAFDYIIPTASIIVDNVKMTIPFKKIFNISPDPLNYVSSYNAELSNKTINTFGYSFFKEISHLSVNYKKGDFNISSRTITFSKIDNISLNLGLKISLVLNDILLLLNVSLFLGSKVFGIHKH